MKNCNTHITITFKGPTETRGSRWVGKATYLGIEMPSRTISRDFGNTHEQDVQNVIWEVLDEIKHVRSQYLRGAWPEHNVTMSSNVVAIVMTASGEYTVLAQVDHAIDAKPIASEVTR